MTALTEWGTFYEVMGSAAGALTGLQFVTMALISDMPISPGETEAGYAFATPQIVHFGTVLFLAAILSAPWHELKLPALVWGVTGVLGIVYTVSVARQMRAQHSYKPVLEDWIFHTVLPLVAHIVLIVSGFTVFSQMGPAPFGVAAGALLLLVIGIHNAWDNTTYLVLRKRVQSTE